MKSRFRFLCVVAAVFSLSGCDKPAPPAAAVPAAAETDNQLAEAHDALQRQALEIETKTALMDKQLAEMQQSLKDRENVELQSKLEALKRQNEAMRAQADAARRQSDAIAERIAATPAPNAPPPAEAQPDYSLFYERLAPYGRWSEVNGYGYCWQPTISMAGWRPYLDGCWVWSSFGWAWQSNEPFGWATYHYGRWLNLASYGWVWVPGNEWAPAWVAWRQSSDCVGWAPLPPEQGICSGVYRDCDSRYGLGPASYVFINTNLFVSPSYINVCAPVAQRARIFQCSVNVTQIVPRSGHRHAFVQQGGPPRAQMEHACDRQVPQRPVQTLHAGQMPAQWHPHERTEAHAPVAIVELPVLAPSAPVRHPEVREPFQSRDRVGGFEGAPHHVAAENRESSTKEKETAAVPPSQHQSAHGHPMHEPARQPFEAPAVTNAAPVANVPVQESARPAFVAERPAEAAAVPQPQEQGRMSHESRRHPVVTTRVINPVSGSSAQPQEAVRSVVDAEHPVAAAQHSSGAGREHGHPVQPAVRAPATPSMPPETKVVESSTSPAAPPAPLVQMVMPATVENKVAEPLSAARAPVMAPAQAAPVVVSAPPQVVPQQPASPIVSPPPVLAEKMANDQGAANAAAEQARLRAAAEQQAQATAMEQRQQRELQERAMMEKKAAEQAAATAEAEKSRMQAVAAQQEALAAQQQRMAAEQAAAETEKARQQAAAVAAQQQQEMAAQQQRANAERMATEQAAAEAERVRQQTEATAMQRKQEEATRRAAEEQQMRAQQETERRAQEMAQRQAEEAARRQREAEMQRVQEQARAQQEAAQRAQETAQRQAEEAARRAQEAAQRAAAEAARNQPQPKPPGA
jgi:predicted small lipoprotein YifL